MFLSSQVLEHVPLVANVCGFGGWAGVGPADDGEGHPLLQELDILQDMEPDVKVDPTSMQRHQLIVEVQAAINDAEEHKRAKNAASLQVFIFPVLYERHM